MARSYCVIASKVRPIRNNGNYEGPVLLYRYNENICLIKHLIETLTKYKHQEAVVQLRQKK